MITFFNPIKGLVKDLNLPKIIFKEDLNLIVGRNGIGKSVILNALATFTLVPKTKGWNSCENEMYSKYNCECRYDIEKMSLKGFKDFLKIHNPYGEFENDYDGSAAYYMSSDKLKDKIGNFYESQSSMGSFNFSEVLKDNFSTNSSGQKMCEFISKLKDIEIPSLENILLKYKSYNEQWQFKANMFIEYLKSFSGENFNNKPILLLDELDTNLDFENAYFFHNQLLKDLSNKFQVICISHSPFALLNKNNIIHLDNSYENLNNLLKKL